MYYINAHYVLNRMNNSLLDTKKMLSNNAKFTSVGTMELTSRSGVGKRFGVEFSPTLSFLRLPCSVV